MAYLILDEWDCNLYWWIFIPCSVLPALTEAALLIGALTTKRSL